MHGKDIPVPKKIQYHVSFLDVDCYTGNGFSYKGTANTTVSGKTCVNWSYLGFSFAKDSRNYCRNFFALQGATQPVCYILSEAFITEPCGVPKCGEIGVKIILS
jgi:receptor tyrosine kinase-like orphan receptor 1